MQIWRINTRTQVLTIEEIPDTWQRLGGRGLIARILLDEVPATCHPLGPDNKLILAPGLLSGHMVSSCDRLSVGTKSPLTGGIKESNAGGTTALQISHLGLKAIIFEDQPGTNEFTIVHLSQKGVTFYCAEEIFGLGVYAAAAVLRNRFGPRCAIMLIGPAGEMKLLASGISNLDKDGVPSRINARGGVGAVMGSKHIKAIIIDAEKGQKPDIHDRKAFKAAQFTYNKALLEHPQISIYRDYGTDGVASMANGFAALPVRGFSQGQFDIFDQIGPDHLREELLSRGGTSNPTHACMPGCLIQCSNIYGDRTGKPVVSPLEYETIALMGANLGIGDLDSIARLNWECNDAGVDTIDTGAALGVAAQAGLLEFGDYRRALELIHEIRKGTPLGRIIGNGAALAGKVLCIRRVPVAKNQALSGYDPRAIKGTGVTYATSPQGGDHTAGLTIRAKIDHQSIDGQAELSRKMQIFMAGFDTLGICAFSSSVFLSSPSLVRDFLNARYAWCVSDDILQELGRETLKMEREYNKRAGFSSANDRLPEWLLNEPLPPTGAIFNIPDEELDGVYNW